MNLPWSSTFGNSAINWYSQDRRLSILETGMVCRFEPPKYGPKNFMSKIIISLLLFWKYISVHLMYFNRSWNGQNTLKLSNCILKTIPAQCHKTKHESLVDAFFLIHHFCTFLLPLNSINSGHKHLQQPMQLNSDTTWPMSWDVPVKEYFQYLFD